MTPGAAQYWAHQTSSEKQTSSPGFTYPRTWSLMRKSRRQGQDITYLTRWETTNHAEADPGNKLLLFLSIQKELKRVALISSIRHRSEYWAVMCVNFRICRRRKWWKYHTNRTRRYFDYAPVRPGDMLRNTSHHCPNPMGYTHPNTINKGINSCSNALWFK